MSREDILRLADKVGMMPFAMTPRHQSQLAKQLGEFAALVATAEREACAQVCDEVIRDLYIVDGDASEEVFRCAKTIRARGEVKL